MEKKNWKSCLEEVLTQVFLGWDIIKMLYLGRGICFDSSLKLIKKKLLILIGTDFKLYVLQIKNDHNLH